MTPGSPTYRLEHGPGFVVLTFDDAVGRVLHPDRADELANRLWNEAVEARQALYRTHLAIPPQEA